MVNQHEYLIASENLPKNNCFPPVYEETIKSQLLQLAQNIEWVMNHPLQARDSNQYREHYLALLKKLGLANYKGRVDRRQWVQAFLGFYGHDFLKLLESDISIDEESNWVTMIVQKHRKVFHPIRHLLVMNMLGEPLDYYFDNQSSYHPFGKGLWNCLNPAASHYEQRVVNDLVITRCSDTKRPVGTFRCDCGFVYSRRGPDQNENDQYKIGRIKKFGHVWEEKLLTLMNEGRRLRSIARELKCDPNTVKRQATLLGIPYSWEGASLEEVAVKSNLQKFKKEDLELLHYEKYRLAWTELLTQYPAHSKTELRKIRPDVYMWLYRHDRVWLDGNSPNKKSPEVKQERVNWEERDEKLLAEIKKVINAWDHQNEKPKRITLRAVGCKINELSLLENCKDKIPRTIEYIQSVEEKIEDFQIRRIQWVVEQLIPNGEEVLEWKIYRQAGLRPNASFKVKRFISTCVNNTDYEHSG
ncbi:TnsD family Tn7-like transposition protein [Metabacillus sp. YM-086]|uniref:TnsD family Tn7-like transposition protein n=1 Tax=Metabacillus sp. YM-086 TaxID=3341729 RepID=UPI003A8BE26E